MVREAVGNLGEGIANAVSPYTVLPKIACPFTTVLNRALVTNFAADALPRFGRDRVSIQQIQDLPGESGLTGGERVFKPINDVHDAVRFVGGAWGSFNDANGQYSQHPSASTSDYLEITFYGTGLNVLVGFNTTANRSVNVYIDGVFSSLLPFTGTTGSPVLNGRNYSLNIPFNVATGLSLGLHTVRLVGNGVSAHLYNGYEVLNTNATLQLVPGSSYNGSRKITKSVLSTDPYSSNFESGALGTRGGHVLVYQKPDNLMAKAVMPTNASQLNLSSADHTNETVLRMHSPREFGAGRADDFSGTATSSAFTLDDGTTTLVSSVVTLGAGYQGSIDSIILSGNGSFWTLTFVGTGLDVMVNTGASVTSDNTMAFIIDGGASQTINFVASKPSYIQKVVSGLPYGTHTVKFLRSTASAQQVAVSHFLVYVPSKPALPTGAVEIADYFVMADFVSQVVAGAEKISTGVLRTALSVREAIYSGTWTAPSFSASSTTGFFTASNTASSYIEYVFFGTGFDFRFVTPSPAASYTLSIDGTNPTAAGATTTGFYNGVTSFTAATGVIVVGSSLFGSGVTASGLTLGRHTVRITYTSGNTLQPEAIDVITPVHSPKVNGPGVVQNTLSVGSCAIRDLRSFSPQQVQYLKAWSQAVGISSGNTTASVSPVPLPDMSVTIKTAGNPIEVAYSVVSRDDTITASVLFRIYIDGIFVGQEKKNYAAAVQAQATASDSFLVPLAAGVHKVDVYWYVSSGSGEAISTLRNLKVREI